MKKINSIFAGVVGIFVVAVIAFAVVSTFNSCSNTTPVEEEVITINDPVVCDTLVPDTAEVTEEDTLL